MEESEAQVSDLARISSDVYKLQRNDIGKYKYVHGKDYIGLYESDTHYIIAHKGSQSLSQFDADRQLLSGVQPKYVSDRIKETSDLIKSLNINSGKKVIQVGHSLGGFVATETLKDPYIHTKTNKVITFNPYTIHGQKSLLQKGAESKIFNHRVYTDIASDGHLRGNTLTYAKRKRGLFSSYDSHSLQNFF